MTTSARSWPRFALVAATLATTAVAGCTLLDPLGYLQSGGADAGACDDGQTSCPGSCVDLASDAANCGACGHDCQGGTCAGGACTPIVLAKAGAVMDLTVAGDTVYFTDSPGGTVLRCAAAGCPAGPDVVASGELSPDRVVADGERVYWTDYAPDGGVLACALSGCDAGRVVFATGQPQAQGIAVTDASIFWSNNVQVDGSVNACPLSGCPAAGPTLIAGGPGPGSVLASDDALFWVVNPGNKVLTCPLGGCDGGPQAFASGLQSPYFLALHAGILYWSDYDPNAGEVLACPVTGCGSAPTIIAKDEAPEGIAVDDSGVYWVTNTALGTVRSCPLTGCGGAAPRTLASGQASPFAIAVSATSIFWTNTGDGTVMKLAKP